ncbi:MAG: hypothetical protein ABIQ79_00405 [Nitrospiraceae bacterium]
MMTCHILVDGDDSVLTNHLLHTIRAKVSTDFGIKHLTIQMATACCHPDEIHCDLTTLVKQHQDEGVRTCASLKARSS